MGAGAPVAVLDVGLRDWSLAWRALQPELAKITRICISDRAGYGFSDPGPLPRDSVAETLDLENALSFPSVTIGRASPIESQLSNHTSSKVTSSEGL